MVVFIQKINGDCRFVNETRILKLNVSVIFYCTEDKFIVLFLLGCKLILYVHGEMFVISLNFEI